MKTERRQSLLARASDNSSPLVGALVIVFVGAVTLAGLGYLGMLPAVLSVFAALVSLGVKDHYDRKRGIELAVTEEKRAIYKRLMAPWARILSRLRDGDPSSIELTPQELEELFAAGFDASLYAPPEVMRAYVAFRRGGEGIDNIDMLLRLTTLLRVMRDDILGEAQHLEPEVMLGTFVNLDDAEIVLVRLRTYVKENPEKAAAAFIERGLDPRELFTREGSIQTPRDGEPGSE